MLQAAGPVGGRFVVAGRPSHVGEAPVAAVVVVTQPDRRWSRHEAYVKRVRGLAKGHPPFPMDSARKLRPFCKELVDPEIAVRTLAHSPRRTRK